MSFEGYEAQVRLLMRVLPELGRQDVLALKGGTALNLFVQDLPRLSVDIDLAYVGGGERGEALTRIHEELQRLTTTLERLGLRVKGTPLSGTASVVKLTVATPEALVKVEVNPVIRGSVYPPRRLDVTSRVQDQFGFASTLTLSEADLYGGKLTAALDRQHPRDLFDVHLFLQQGRFTRDVLSAFLVYLISHPRPPHELLRPHFKDLTREFTSSFVGMTAQPIDLAVLEAARDQLVREVHARFTEDDRAFLLSVAAGAPEWDRLDLVDVDALPAVRWKLANVAKMTPDKRRAALKALEDALTDLP